MLKQIYVIERLQFFTLLVIAFEAATLVIVNPGLLGTALLILLLIGVVAVDAVVDDVVVVAVVDAIDARCGGRRLLHDKMMVLLRRQCC